MYMHDRMAPMTVGNTSSSRLPAGIAAALVAALAGLALVVAPAWSATPEVGMYQQIASNGNLVIALKVDARHRVAPSYYNRCAPVPVVYKFPVKADGSFSFAGTRNDVLGNPIRIAISGKFVTGTKATGTVKYTARGCSATAKKFAATFRPASV